MIPPNSTCQNRHGLFFQLSIAKNHIQVIRTNQYLYAYTLSQDSRAFIFDGLIQIFSINWSSYWKSLMNDSLDKLGFKCIGNKQESIKKKKKKKKKDLIINTIYNGNFKYFLGHLYSSSQYTLVLNIIYQINYQHQTREQISLRHLWLQKFLPFFPDQTPVS